MAYIDQERKAIIASELKKVIPAGWKWSLAIRSHMTLIMTISEAPFDLLAAITPRDRSSDKPITEAKVNHHYVREQFQDECVADVFEKIVAALNTGNHDRSDSMTDYFDVGWYLDIRIGRWDKPFKYTPAAAPVISK